MVVLWSGDEHAAIEGTGFNRVGIVGWGFVGASLQHKACLVRLLYKWLHLRSSKSRGAIFLLYLRNKKNKFFPLQLL
jgi:hypothetical protein